MSIVCNGSLLAVERGCLLCILAFNIQARAVIMCIMCWQACYSQAAEERSAGRVPAETKECRRCHETKGKADFYHSKMTADGLQSYCKVCSSCSPYGALPSLLQSSDVPEAAWACLACAFTRVCLSMKVTQVMLYARLCMTGIYLHFSNATLWHQHSGAPGQQRAPSRSHRLRTVSKVSACTWRTGCLSTRT